VDYLRAAWQVSIRRACGALQAERSSYHYKGKRTDPVALKTRIKEIAETRVRYGYRRITVLLKREGWPVNGKKIYRLYKELGLSARRHLGLQPARQADRQRLRRVLQWQGSGRMPEHRLIHVPR